MSEERKEFFKVWRRGKKNVSVEFRMFGKRKKKEIERKVPRKKIKVFFG